MNEEPVLLREPPDECVRAYKQAERKDKRYFERNPEKMEFTRPYIYGEFWPLDLPAGIMVRVIKIDDENRIRHALTDAPVPYPGYELEAEFFQEVRGHMTNEQLTEWIQSRTQEDVE